MIPEHMSDDKLEAEFIAWKTWPVSAKETGISERFQRDMERWFGGDNGICNPKS